MAFADQLTAINTFHKVAYTGLICILVYPTAVKYLLRHLFF